MSRSPATLGLVLAVTVLAGCEHEAYEAPPEEGRIELADSLYSPALFDTIAWASSAERITAGNLVYADHCRRCHGPVGEGGPASVAGREFVVPSLVRADWPFGDDIAAVRHRTFTGHTGGMPSWGLTRLTPREIDAVASYLVEQLRPEMLADPSSPSAIR